MPRAFLIKKSWKVEEDVKKVKHGKGLKGEICFQICAYISSYLKSRAFKIRECLKKLLHSLVRKLTAVNKLRTELTIFCEDVPCSF